MAWFHLFTISKAQMRLLILLPCSSEWYCGVVERCDKLSVYSRAVRG